MKLLIAYDDEPCSQAALAELSRAALPAHTEAIVACFADVLVPPNYTREELTAEAGLPQTLRAVRIRAREMWDAAWLIAESGASQLKRLQPSWHVEALSEADSPVWGIVRIAETRGLDLIVMGSHNRGSLGRLLLGSVAQKVLNDAGCSVRVVRGSDAAAALVRVMVAIDGSENSGAMLLHLAHRSWPPGTHFDVVGVLDSQVETASLWYQDGVSPEELRAPDVWMKEMLEENTEGFMAGGYTASCHFHTGNPRTVLVELAEHLGTECIYLASRGLHYAPSRRLGSVAAAVAARAHCTVEVVRPKS